MLMQVEAAAAGILEQQMLHRLRQQTYVGGDLSESTYGRVWAKARVIALTDTQAASDLARHPYDLRHACVSTSLQAGTEPKRVAEWAGHSVEVLLRIYTHCLDQGEHEALRRIQRTLGEH